MFASPYRRVRNCHYDLIAYHKASIALPPSWYAELRGKRDKLRAAIKRRLSNEGHRQPLMFRGQGSVAMGTITRGGWYGDYDIDDGIYFSRAALTGPNGGLLSPLAARQRVLEAVYTEHFYRPPECHKNCVRVFYAAEFHIDIPVYRLSGNIFGPAIELASSSWKISNPAGVTNWFKTANAKSPGFGSHRQLARMVRYIKFWTRSRSAWQMRMPSGFAVTKLVVDCYRPFADRDDRALLHLLVVMHHRLQADTFIQHPVLKDEFICGPGRDATVRHLRDCIGLALSRLQPLFEGTSREEALGLWDSFFNDEFFWNRPNIIFI